jgi:DNA-binding XRE family transcriptional regulator
VRATINAIENERFDPSLKLAFQIAELFDMAIEDVFVYGEALAEREKGTRSRKTVTFRLPRQHTG